jgi:hypothetical protein
MLSRMMFAGAALALVASVAAAQVASQPPTVVNGTVDVRAAGPSLERAVEAAGAGAQAAWAGYTVQTLAGDYRGDEYGGARCGTVYLEGRRTGSDEGGQARRSEPRSIVILFRLANGSVERIRTSPPDCDLDAGGLAVRWLTGVDPALSVALLSRYVKVAEPAGAKVPSWNSAMSALALHAAPSATRALERFAGADQPVAIRKQAAFWLGASRGTEGFATLRRYAEAEPDAAFRKELTFALSVCRDPGATDVLIRMARNDANADVRRQAIFWLGQKAGNKVAGTLADAAERDPETAIKERAVFALSRLPDGEGVPKLIEVARTNPDLAVRKRAIFWLAQSGDRRAVDYIAALLR